MSSVSRNTRSQANPSQTLPAAKEKIKITITKPSRTGTVATSIRQETAEKEASEQREAAIAKLVDTEAQIAANRAANRKSLARPLPDGGCTDGTPDGHSHSRGQVHSGSCGGGGSRDSGGHCSDSTHCRNPGLGQAATEDTHWSARALVPDLGDATDDSTGHLLPVTNICPVGLAIRTGLDTRSDSHNPGKGAGPKNIPTDNREKESRGRGIRGEVAERVRLCTDAQAIDPPDGTAEADDEAEPTLAPTSKRKKPPPPPTISAAKRARLGDALVVAPLHASPTMTTIVTTTSTPLIGSAHGQVTREDSVIDRRLSSSKRALSAAQKRSMPITLEVRHRSSTTAQNATPNPVISNISDGRTEDVDNSSGNTENQPITNEASFGGASKPRERPQSKPDKKESTRGRNRSDLPQQYNMFDTRFDDRFLPEVQHLYGLEPDPWGRPAVALVQRARDKVFTEFQDTLTTKSAVFRNAKESLSSWRRALLKKAEKVIENYFEDENRFPTASDIAHQAQFLLGDGAVIPWLFKDGPDVTKIEDFSSTGYYRSSFIVETLAVHFERSSTCPATTQVHPAGALAIALLALERTLKSWLTGEHVLPASDFSLKNCREDTNIWIRGISTYSVARWKRLLTAVEELNPPAYKLPGPSTAGVPLPLTNDPRTQAPPSSDVENDPE